MNVASASDLGLLGPEFTLVFAALAMILVSRRVGNASWFTAGTGGAALAAGGVIWFTLAGPQTGFGRMYTVDTDSQFFKVLILSGLALSALLSVERTTPGSAEVRLSSRYRTTQISTSLPMRSASSACPARRVNP